MYIYRNLKEESLFSNEIKLDIPLSPPYSPNTWHEESSQEEYKIETGMFCKIL